MGGDASQPFRLSPSASANPHAAVVAHLVGRIEPSGTRVAASTWSGLWSGGKVRALSNVRADITVK